MKKNITPISEVSLSLAGAVVLGAVIAAFSPGSYWQGWLAAGVISFVSIYLLVLLWRKLSGGKTLALLLLVTFVLRLAVGIYINKALPVVGYDTPVQNAGYFYSDAYNRDQAAFKLATGPESLFVAFGKEYDKVDQYGGLLFISALIYRILSPDIIRPLLIVLLAAFAMAAGVGFLFAVVQKRWGMKIALLTGWIFCLFPDSILLGSTQMREPFLIALACIGFWAILQWQGKPVRAASISLIAMAAACLISVPAGFVITAILTASFLIDWILNQSDAKRRTLGYAILVILAALAVVGGWMWLRKTLYYDAYTTKLASGWITMLIKKYGEKWNIPFVTIYGLTQPLLPAAIFEPSLPFWVVVGILRALGWYLALPLLLFGISMVWKANKNEHKWLLGMLYVAFLLWVVVSSGRAGGDQWDNPRYRYIFLPFMALILAWAIEKYRETHSVWLWRWVAVIGVFLAFFTYFYLSRYVGGVFRQIPFLWIIALIAGIDALILAGSVVWDLLHKRQKAG